MAIRTRRRARFRRATSGTQNLTLLIYNILKEQQASQKSALLSAFDANMASASYDSTYGGQPADRAAVEAWYAQAIAAYPEGTTERDRLTAELAEFRTRAIDKEMEIYGRAYQDGTYAFGQKVTFESYMSFLRNARNGTSDPVLKQKYLTEEFIVNFNDINDDMQARGASSSALLSFYRRQLKIAQEQGVGNDNIRKIERYITQAAKQAAADGKREAQEKAGKILSKRTGEVANAIASAIDAASNAGEISGQAAYELKSLNPMQLVNAFLKMDPATKASILRSGTNAGVMLNGENISGQGIFDYVNNTRDELKAYANADWVDIDTRTYLRGILSEFDRTILAGSNLLTATELAADSGDTARFNSAKGLGNPLVNVESLKLHAENLRNPSLSDAVGAGSIALLNGLVPNPDQFNGKKNLSELTPVEAEELANTFGGELFLDGNRQGVIQEIIASYAGVAKLQSGGSYLELTIDPNSGQPVVQVTDEIKPGRKVYLYSTKLDGGVGRITSAVQQVPSRLVDGNKNTVGEVVLEIDSAGNINRSIITADGYKIDFDDYELFLDSQGINPQQDQNGDFVFANTSGIYNGEAMKLDPRFSKLVPETKWNGVLLGADSPAAEEDIRSRITDLAYTTPGGPAAITFEIDENGNNVARVNDPALVAARLGLTESDLNQIMKATPKGDAESFGSKIVKEAGVKFFRSQEGNENRASMNQPIDQAEIDRLRARGQMAVAQYEERKAKAEQDRFMTPLAIGSSLVPGGRAALGLAQAAYNFATQTPAEQKAFQSAVKLGAFSGPKYAQSATTGTTPSDPSEYFFRYTQLTAPPQPSGAGTSLSPYMSTLASPPKTGTTTARPTFTPAEVQLSFNQYRASERAPLNISTSTSTVRK
jgi:hypothetical protein